jgi:hypothetical protein
MAGGGFSGRCGGDRAHRRSSGCDVAQLKTTRYFEEQVLRKRPYIERQWVLAVVVAPIRREIQADGRVRLWGKVQLPGETKILRVVTLEDGETIHNAFFDRNFREEQG